MNKGCNYLECSHYLVPEIPVFICKNCSWLTKCNTFKFFGLYIICNICDQRWDKPTFPGPVWRAGFLWSSSMRQRVWGKKCLVMEEGHTPSPSELSESQRGDRFKAARGREPITISGFPEKLTLSSLVQGSSTNHWVAYWTWSVAF